jgi:hypothetical protein
VSEGCTEAQGYYPGKLQPAREVQGLIESLTQRPMERRVPLAESA